MKAAIQSGLYTDNSTILDIQPTCSSGNCTWPSYRSLAICARFADVTSHLKSKKISIQDSLTGDRQTETQWYLSKLNYIIDDGVSLLNLSSAAGLQPIFDEYQSPILLNFSNSIAFQNSSSPVADIFAIYSNSTKSTSDHTATFLAIEFVLEWCVQNFTTSVSNGQSSTERYDSFNDFGKPNHDDTVLFAKPDDGDNRNYSVDFAFHYPLQNYFRGLLQGTANLTSDTTPIVTNDATQAFFQAIDIFGRKVDGVDQAPGRGVGLVGLQMMLDNVATGMTNM